MKSKLLRLLLMILILGIWMTVTHLVVDMPLLPLNEIHSVFLGYVVCGLLVAVLMITGTVGISLLWDTLGTILEPKKKQDE